MDRSPPAEAVAVAEATRGALARLGGVDAARRAEADPGVRAREIEPLLRELGLLDVAPFADPTETIAGALAVREAGAVVCPWPLIQALSVTDELEGATDAVYVVGAGPHRIEHLDLFESPLALDLYGGAWLPQPRGLAPAPMPLDPFGVDCEWTPATLSPSTPALLLGQTMNAFWILGALGTVLKQSAAYARERHQFGRPIGRFGATRWRLADMLVAHSGLEELALYTLWCVTTGRATHADVLALRLVAIESAHTVLHHGHQILAAIGLCDEHDVSIIDRHLQPLIRRPAGSHETTELLADHTERDGFDGLFPIASLKVGDNP